MILFILVLLENKEERMNCMTVINSLFFIGLSWKIKVMEIVYKGLSSSSMRKLRRKLVKKRRKRGEKLKHNMMLMP